jgi:hypothetical protein
MRRFVLLTLVLATVIAFTGVRPAAARMLGDPSVPFSADRALTVGDRTFMGKVYAVPGSQRHELMIGEIPQVIILHGADAKGWLILPGLNSFVEFGFAKAALELSDGDLLSTKLGQEVIDGHRTTKYRIEHTAQDGTMVDGYLWQTAEGIPMRLDGMYTPANGGKPTPVRMELSHVQLGPQNASLFVVPQNMVKLPTGALGPLLGAKKAG